MDAQPLEKADQMHVDRVGFDLQTLADVLVAHVLHQAG